MASLDAFKDLDIRVGTVVKSAPFPQARRPAIKMEIDFGPLGVKRSSAQITRRYTPKAVEGKQVIALVNVPPKLIAGFRSEVLVLGGVAQKGDVVLIAPDQPLPNGTPIA